MTVLLCIGGAVIGGGIGLWLGEREGGDYNFAPVIYGPIGATVGAIAGTIIGSAIS